MPEFNKSRGFKMSGYSYPGKSPLKGKKAEQQAAGAANRATALGKSAELGDKKMESTDIMSQKSEIGSGPPKKGYPVSPARAEGGNVWGELGKELATTAIKEGVGVGVKAATGGFKKEKGKRQTADASGLAGIKFGK